MSVSFDHQIPISHLMKHRRGYSAWRGLTPLAMLLITLAASSIFGHSASSAATAQNEEKRETNVFRMAAAQSLQKRYTMAVTTLLRKQRYAEAEKALKHLIGRFPNWAAHHYNLAVALARQNRPEEALDQLVTAIDLGFSNKGAVTRDPGLTSLNNRPRFKELVDRLSRHPTAAANKPRKLIIPRLVQDGRAIIDGTNTAWLPHLQTLVSAFSFTEKPSTQIVHGGNTPTSRLLNLWFRRGNAAGNHGDIYDNRDDGHSRLPKELFPQISHTDYHANAREEGMHYGVNSHFLFNAILFGNSSTAITGRQWRSQPRLIMTKPQLVVRAYQQYANNHLYIYPEHRDHDPETGDLFPANTPYMIISQGSSGSDRPFMQAVSAILAALRPDVKAFLRAKNLVMPTVQMIFRSSLNSVTTPNEYLSAKAHPSVFDSADIDFEKIIHRAQSLTKNAVPPRMQITVLKESRPMPSISYFGSGSGDEILFNTPGAIARIVRSTEYEKRMVISAALTADPNDHPLTFTWRILRGDADRISIKKLENDASTVELRIPWHNRRPVPFNTTLMTDRVDIAVFAHNGLHYSAPAFVSLYYPPHQERQYDSDGRILEIDYVARELEHRYADPALFAQRPWRDRYHYTDKGQLIGWDRFSDGKIRRFTRHGAIVLETDAERRPTKAEVIRYEAKRNRPESMKIVEIPTGAILNYFYRDKSDVLGTFRHTPKQR